MGGDMIYCTREHWDNEAEIRSVICSHILPFTLWREEMPTDLVKLLRVWLHLRGKYTNISFVEGIL